MQPLEILQSQRMAEFLNNLSEILDWVVIDSPPMTPIADSGVWSSLCDGILVVVREGLTLSKLFSQTVESIDAKKFLGVVINGASMSESQYNASYYYHSQQKK